MEETLVNYYALIQSPLYTTDTDIIGKTRLYDDYPNQPLCLSQKVFCLYVEDSIQKLRNQSILKVNTYIGLFIELNAFYQIFDIIFSLLFDAKILFVG